MKIFRYLLAAWLALAPIPAFAVSPFTWAPGTNGFTTTPFNGLTTELNALASGAAATSSVGGTSGTFSQTNTGNSLQAEIWFVFGGAVTPTAGAVIQCWFRISSDGGTTFEALTATPSTTVAPFQRSPDFTVPVSNAAYALNQIASAQGRRVTLPPDSFQITCWNLTGGALPATGNKIVIGPVNVQY